MAEQDIINTIEDNVDTVVESVVPEVYETVEAVRNNPVLLVGVALVGLSVGAVIGYQVAKKRLTTKFDERLQHEIEEARAYYDIVNKTGDFATAESAAEALGVTAADAADAHADYGTGIMEGDTEVELDVTTVETEVKVRNIFVDGEPLVDSDWDQEAEEADRSKERPYIISQEEYFENEPEHEQITVTYYEGDDVLADSSDDVIQNTDSNVGDDNLLKFGHGSKDPNLLYVRNEKSGLDFEIAHSDGKYAVEVLALDEADIAQTVPMRRRQRGSEE